MVEYKGKRTKVNGELRKEISKLKQRKLDDILKKQLCQEKGITLVQIPYRDAEKDLVAFLRHEFRKNSIKVKVPSIDSIDLSSAYSPNPMDEVHELARKKGGKCLSVNYVSAKTPMIWQCAKGHVWETTFDTVQSGSWCPDCGGVKSKTIKDAIKLAESKGGKFLSKTFKTTKDKYWWQCDKGHPPWKTTYSAARRHWCRTCSKKHYLNITEIQRLAHSREGKCLSKRYKNSKTKLKIQCKKGHVWKINSDKLIQGRWCPICANSRKGASQRLNIEMMQEIAGQRGGECLSKSYKNARLPLKWRCAEGHVWKATADYVKNQGYWCRKCDKEDRQMYIKKMAVV